MSVKPVQLINTSPHHHQHEWRTPLLLYPSVVCLVGSLIVLQAFSPAAVHVKAASVAAASEAVVEESSSFHPVSWSLLNDPGFTRPSVIEQSVGGVPGRRLSNKMKRFFEGLSHFTVYRCGPVVLFTIFIYSFRSAYRSAQQSDAVKTSDKEILKRCLAPAGILMFLVIPTWTGYREPLVTDGTLPWISSKTWPRNVFKNVMTLVLTLIIMYQYDTRTKMIKRNKRRETE
eukprot:GHVQ01002266.1.p1 GENE.GHVQ01002266.1~~GHVQ01002266.1.p1  ORF type:complete len:230 (+),score=24.03 GHVQ01002266.1:105-794(+)